MKQSGWSIAPIAADAAAIRSKKNLNGLLLATISEVQPAALF
jgi:hypothetical protein